MPLRIQMDRLIAICRRRVDMKTNQARTDADFKELISEQYGDLWGVVSENGGRYFETSVTFTADGSEYYTEPVDHLSSVRMARVLSDGREQPLLEVEARDEWRFKGMTGDAYKYTIVDDSVYLYPRPSSGTYKLYYIQQATDLSQYADDDVVDVVNAYGLKFLAWGVAVMVHGELEGSATLAIAERDKAHGQLLDWCVNRVLNAPRLRVIEPAGAEESWNPAGFWNRP